MSAVRSFDKRKKFLDELELGMSPSRAAMAAGESLGFFKRWKESDANFARDWDEAVEQGTDYLEDEATIRATKKSDPLMMFMLKARRPDKYDRGSKLELSGGISVEGSKAKLLNKLAKMRGVIEGTVISSSNEDPGDQPAAAPAQVEKEQAPQAFLPKPSAAPVNAGGSKRQRATGRSKGV